MYLIKELWIKDMKEIEVDGNLSAITACLNEFTDSFNSVWFRGQPSYEHKLIPSIFRQGINFGINFDEQRMFDEFKRRYPDQSNSHKSSYEWLTLMQHYGLPTRLLDWSSNLLVGLYFCCINEIEKDGSLYVFDPTNMERNYQFNELLEMQIQEKSRSDFYHRIIYKMDGILDEDSLLNGIALSELRSNLYKRVKFTGLSTGSNENFESLSIKTSLPNTVDMDGNVIPHVYQDIKRAFSNIIPFKAPHLNPRIRQQHGFFTFHGGMYIDGEEFIPVGNMEDEMYTRNSLIKIKILKSDKENLLRELAYSGIKESTLFPEMEYQAKEIKEWFSSITNQKSQ